MTLDISKVHRCYIPSMNIPYEMFKESPEMQDCVIVSDIHDADTIAIEVQDLDTFRIGWFRQDIKMLLLNKREQSVKSFKSIGEYLGSDPAAYVRHLPDSFSKTLRWRDFYGHHTGGSLADKDGEKDDVFVQTTVNEVAIFFFIDGVDSPVVIDMTGDHPTAQFVSAEKYVYELSLERAYDKFDDPSGHRMWLAQGLGTKHNYSALRYSPLLHYTDLGDVSVSLWNYNTKNSKANHDSEVIVLESFDGNILLRVYDDMSREDPITVELAEIA